MKRPVFLITAGPTREAIDPVRYLSNHSSGKMGYELARAALKKGSVILISGPTSLTPPKGVIFIPVISALDMYKEVMKNYRKADVIIKVAAVADYRPVTVSKQKIKKTKNVLTIKLVKNPDILMELGHKKRKNQILVGFAAETNKPLDYAQKKLKQKKCDFVVVNDVSRKDIGFGSDQNQVVLLSRSGSKLSLGKQSKYALASKIISLVTVKS